MCSVHSSTMLYVILIFLSSSFDFVAVLSTSFSLFEFASYMHICIHCFCQFPSNISFHFEFTIMCTRMSSSNDACRNQNRKHVHWVLIRIPFIIFTERNSMTRRCSHLHVHHSCCARAHDAKQRSESEQHENPETIFMEVVGCFLAEI